ncbi:MAG: GntR family transcriptional regulator [Clostridiaceae bacterium]|uniref:GntR family transcriptional regulator n=1 Tax=Clostridium porci TaxID=2605778 RepID=A0A7X2TE87_9CLOT|nr:MULTISPECIES: GntR family transcriptional regulator [Clostridium]MCI6139973.1 GntR family transcriptional regulator [Clostridium sp.]MDU3398161.1 GntR family transcriptional regulator [Clostridiales bacterium]MDY3232267.1 GntR family transcriptional regulator [Clostridiaceae bacterium]MSS38350.1 GntR family transcriptional regulator [Clostridium porci]
MNSKSAKPLYLQIDAAIRNDIQTHIYKAGDKLPTEVELSQKYNVSKITIRKAMDKLSQDGMVQKVQGKGTFVLPRKDKVNLSESKGFADSLSSMGHSAKQNVLAVKSIPSDSKLSECLEIEEGNPLFCVERLMWADSRPIGTDTIYVSEERFPGFIQKAVTGKPLYHIFKEDYGVEITSSTMEINGISADGANAALLKCVIGDPLFYIEKTAYDQNGLPVHYSSTLIRCDSITYVVKTNKHLHMEERISDGQNL